MDDVTERSEPGAAADGGGDFESFAHSLELPISHARAFDAYVHGMREWWPRSLAHVGAALADIHVDAAVGGHIIERDERGEEHSVGEVQDIEHGRRIVHTLHAHHAGEPSTVTITFRDAEHGGTIVQLTHEGWTPTNAAARARFAEWPTLLARYAEHATHQ